jgi:hypothetical protein
MRHIHPTYLGLGVVGAATIAFASLAFGCKHDSPTLAESATAVSAAAPPATAKVIAYEIDAKSKTTIDMTGVKEHIKADTNGAAGKLDVDLTNVVNTRGEVKVDLTTLATHTFNDDHDTSQTNHAHNWLEVGDVASAETKKANQYAVFAIQSITALGAADVSKVKPTQENGEDIRTVTMTAHGDFLLHGHKTKMDVPVEARFHYPAGAPADAKPPRVDIKTTAPMKVTLKDYDVRPRDNFGKIAEWTTNLVAKVAETADVSLDIHADLAK